MAPQLPHCKSKSSALSGLMWPLTCFFFPITAPRSLGSNHKMQKLTLPKASPVDVTSIYTFPVPKMVFLTV